MPLQPPSRTSFLDIALNNRFSLLELICFVIFYDKSHIMLVFMLQRLYIYYSVIMTEKNVYSCQS